MFKLGLPFGIGFIVGGVGIYIVYNYMKNKIPQNEKLKKESEYQVKTKEFDEIISNKSYIENLSSKDISSWFKENKIKFDKNVKMIISIPTDEVLKGLGYPITEVIDKDKNILQWFYDVKTGKVLKIRLVSYSNIDSNFQSHLLESKGMIIVTE